MLVLPSGNLIRQNRLESWTRFAARSAHTSPPSVSLRIDMKKQYFVLAMLSVAGCTNRGAYEGIQASKRFECSELPPSQYEDCMREANRSYDEYQRQRSEAEQ